LAAIAQDPTSPAGLRWEHLYHLEQAGEAQALVEHAQQRDFASSFSQIDRWQTFGRTYTEAFMQPRHCKMSLRSCASSSFTRTNRADQALSEIAIADLLAEMAEEADCATILMVGDELSRPIR